jgi:putative flippase GtrA
MQPPEPLEPVVIAARAMDTAGLRRESTRFVKFLAVGGMSFVVDTGSLSLLALGLNVNRVVAKGVGFVLAVLFNFVLNRFWIYPDSRSKPVLAQMAQFATVSIVGLLINLGIFVLVDPIVSGIVGKVYGLYVTQAVAVGTALMWNFVANRFITYSDVKLGR